VKSTQSDNIIVVADTMIKAGQVEIMTVIMIIKLEIKEDNMTINIMINEAVIIKICTHKTH
jgi:hypothetical protein